MMSKMFVPIALKEHLLKKDGKISNRKKDKKCE